MAEKLRGEQREILLHVLRQSLSKPQPKEDEQRSESPEKKHDEKKLDLLNQVFKEAMRKSPPKPTRYPRKQFVEVSSEHTSKLHNPMEDLGRQLGENAALLARNIAELVALNVQELLHRRQ